MDTQRLVIAIVLCLGLLFGYQMFMTPTAEQAPQQAPQPAAQQPATQQPADQAASPQTPAATAPAQTAQVIEPAVEAKNITVNTPLYTAVFTDKGGALRSFRLKQFSETSDGPLGYPFLEATSLEPSSLSLNLINFDSKLEEKIFSASASQLVVDAQTQEATLSFSCEYSGVTVTRIYTFHADSYAIDHKIIVDNQSSKNLEMTPELTLTINKDKGIAHVYSLTGVATYLNHSYSEVDITDIEGNKRKADTGTIDFMSLNVPYFLSVIAPDYKLDAKRSLRCGTLDSIMYATLVEPPLIIDAGASAEANFLYYCGPQDIDVLTPLGHELKSAVNFGWFDIIAKPMLYALKFCYQYIENYGVGIILVTLLVKILFWPLTRASYKSMKNMQKLQPLVAKIREKHAGDKQAINQETMKLYKSNKINPMGGCFPILIQIPVFFAFYKVLGTAIELRHAPFMLWINDLSAPDRLPIGIDIPFVGPGIPVLTLLMGASMFFQQKMAPMTGDPMQRKLMMFMPIIFTVMFINFPSGLVLYWFFNNILAILQQYLVNRSKK